MVSDVRNVLAWTGRNIPKYGGNPSSIYLMGHGSGAHLALLSLTQEAVVRSRDAYWLSSYSKGNSTTASETPILANGIIDDSSSEPDIAIDDDGDRKANESIEISAGIRSLEIWGGDSWDIPPVKGMILMAGVSDVIKHIRHEFKLGIEEISPLRRALGPSHAKCLTASPSHLIFGAKQVRCPYYTFAQFS